MTNSTIFQIEIPKRGSLCSHCQTAFISGNEFYSILKDNLEDGSWLRQDYCLTCWKNISSQLELTSFKSLWKSKVPPKKEGSDLPKQRDDRAMYLLKEMLQNPEEEAQSQAFVLSLYLARKRLMYFRQDLVLEDGKQASLYEVSQTEEMLCVRKISLSTLEIEKVQLQLAAKFKQ